MSRSLHWRAVHRVLSPQPQDPGPAPATHQTATGSATQKDREGAASPWPAAATLARGSPWPAASQFSGWRQRERRQGEVPAGRTPAPGAVLIWTAAAGGSERGCAAQALRRSPRRARARAGEVAAYREGTRGAHRADAREGLDPRPPGSVRWIPGRDEWSSWRTTSSIPAPQRPAGRGGAGRGARRTPPPRPRAPALALSTSRPPLRVPTSSAGVAAPSSLKQGEEAN